MIGLAVVAFLSLVARVQCAFPNPQPVTGNTAVHDPTMCKDRFGTYFVFSTAPGIEIRTSQDRKNWTLIGTVWPDGAPWTDQYTGMANGNIWAPDCTYRNGEFILYYAASSFGSQDSGIFLARSRTGQPGSFTNDGLVTSTTSADDYNAIDPNLLIVDEHDWVLSLGSFWTGIKEMQLSSNSGQLLRSTEPANSIAERFVNSNSIEASVIFRHDEFYYLFTSWDFCCRGVNSTYNIRVGRSSAPTEGFVDQAGVDLTAGGGTLILGTHGDIIGPGGQDLMVDGDETILLYHYYTPAGSFLGINKLDFSSGWPVVV